MLIREASFGLDVSENIPLAGTGVPGPPLCTMGVSLVRVETEDGIREPAQISFANRLRRSPSALPPPTVVLPDADTGAGEPREDVGWLTFRNCSRT